MVICGLWVGCCTAGEVTSTKVEVYVIGIEISGCLQRKLQVVHSSDFNPVELMWAYVKSILRKLKARTEDALIDAAV